MNRIDLTDQELHVLLALLRNLQGAQKAWLGPSLTGIRQKLERAIVAPEPAPDASVVWRGLDREHLLAPEVAPVSETELRAAHGDR